VKKQVRKRLAANGDIQTRTVRKIRSSESARLMHLGEENLFRRTRDGTPALDAALQGAQLTVRKASGKAPLQVVEQGFGLQSGVKLQLFFELRPDLGKGVVAGAPGTVHAFDLAGKFAEPPVLSCGLGIDASLGRRQFPGATVQVEAAETAHLLIGDHPKPP
jgi:hypothetical protein